MRLITIFGLLNIFMLISRDAYVAPCRAGDKDPACDSLPKSVAGSFSITFKNLTNGAFPNDKIFLHFFGFNGPALANKPSPRATTVKLARRTANGTRANQVLAPTNQLLPGIKLSELANSTIYLPQKSSAKFKEDGKFYGSRIYISLGAPLTTLRVNSDGSGTSQPNFADSDVDRVFDWIEFTYDPENSAGGNTRVSFGGNTTGVDQFSIPIWVKVYGDQGSIEGPAGIALRDKKYSPIFIPSRKAIFDKFAKVVSAPFKKLLHGNQDGHAARILSPVKSANFVKDNHNYFNSYIDEIWEYFSNNPLNFCDVYDPIKKPDYLGSCFVGNIKDNQMVFYRTSGRATGAREDCTQQNPCTMRKPTSQEIFENGGVFALPDDPQRFPNGVVDYNLFASQFVAAIARHSATNVLVSGPMAGYLDWHGKKLPLYAKTPNNEYAKFFHKHGIDHRFYGMGYDDVGAPPPPLSRSDKRDVGGPLLFVNKPGENVKALVIGIQW